MRNPASIPGSPTRAAAHGGARAAILWLAVLVPGCSQPSQVTAPGELRLDEKAVRQADRELVREPFADQSKKAVLRQRTLFEYHFEPGLPDLTPLGKRDLGMLTVQLKNGGTLSVRRGAASDALYAARLDAVKRQLVAEGIPADQVQLTNTLAGGSGISAAGALYIQDSVRGVTAPVLPAGEVLNPQGGAPTQVEGPK